MARTGIVTVRAERSLRSRRLALGLYALATLLAFPHEWPRAATDGAGASFDLGLLFAWIVPAALIVGIDGWAPARAARAAFWASLLGHALLFHWFMIVTIVYGGMPAFLGVWAPLAPALYVSIFTALFAAGWAWLRPLQRFPSLVALLLGAALWVAVDWARGHFLGGFPWATLGYGLHRDLPLLAWTRWGGVYALSFLAVLPGVAFAAWWCDRSRTNARRFAVAVAVVVIAHVWGAGLQRGFSSGGQTLRVAAVQGNIEQGQKWDASRRAQIFETYLRLSQEAARQGADWIVWPETALPGYLEYDGGLRTRLAGFAREHDVALVVGGMGLDFDPTTRQPSAFYDSAFVMDRRGELRERYDKTHLVPFGEFVPLRSLLGRVFQSLARGLATADVTPGPAPRPLAIDGPGGQALGRPVGVPICYELLFPHLVRQFAARDAGLLLAITNDAWYGRTGAPHQFLAMTALRAAENGLWTVRAANTGISAVIDPLGRVRQATPLFEEAIVLAEVRVATEGETTFYSEYGDVFAWACILAVLLSAATTNSKTRAEAEADAVADSLQKDERSPVSTVEP